MRLRELSNVFSSVVISSFLCFTFLALSSALPVHSTELSPDNFKSTIASGIWFIEHFSPYCGHCRAFAPTWEELVKWNEEQTNNGIELAQVNCAVNGDLCDANNVKGYPQMNLYKDGEFVETFKGARDLPRLQEFLKKYANPDVSEEKEIPLAMTTPPSPVYNPSGTVEVLDDSNFQKTLDEGPVFVKFFAPWCGHCKKLAPTWKNLAQSMQNKLTIAEVDCEAHKSLCKTQKIEGFPTLVFFNGGARSEYNGGRKLEPLTKFAEKASGAPTKAIQASELELVVSEESTVYALLYSSSSYGLVNALTPFFAPLFGAPMVYTIADPPSSLSKQFSSTGASGWVLVAFKDHDFQTPSAVYSSTSPAAAISGSKEAEAISQWIQDNKLPTTIELTQDTFQSIMNAPSRPLVVLTGVTSYNKDKVQSKFEEIAKKWRRKTNGSGAVSGLKGTRPIVFAWMDLDRWKDWMKSMYGITKGSQEVDDLAVVIADHQVLQYYDTEVSGDRLKLSSDDIFYALQAVGDGKLSPKNSENFVERMARYLNEKLVSFESYVVNNPFYTLSIVAILGVLVFMVLRNLFKDDPSVDYYGGRMGNAKGDRLD
ncbi:thioredoxin-domain-containing protein [Dendrothele bispora CBS 962.96]|uniref:Thioredoxin-domain-containing protein n=1 Tax=Dendrothele bispora (strain CBS 962.96) TaxID=1314807 RepID=A0A4S8MW97_DENBC|nr:thioredoxin-domain-containing protein [Dendrothele bispora CBS 962.96]